MVYFFILLPVSSQAYPEGHYLTTGGTLIARLQQRQNVVG